ncbi:DUF6197 family protein [Streptomyces sp. NPDC018019]|uniref:DUF6197 family protein n=1 Tax=Streptomyces sp. NPDC018019 TaxID=3365030 RepID=UPI0037A00004
MPPRNRPATPASILAAAADHIERVGLYQGEHLWKPGQMGDDAPCTVLHAWDQGVRAVKPHWSVGGEPWDLFARALWGSLEAVSNHINGRPVPPVRWRELGLCENAYRRTMLWCWGDEPGRTAREAAAAFRAAAELRRSDRDHAVGS